MELDCDSGHMVDDDEFFSNMGDVIEVSKSESLMTFLPDCILERFLLQRKTDDGNNTTSTMAATMTERNPTCNNSYSIIAIFDLCGFTAMAEEMNNEMSAKIFFTENNQRRETWGYSESVLSRYENPEHSRFAASVGGSFIARRARKNYKIMKSQCTDVQARYGTERLRDVIGDFFQALMPIIIGGGGDIIRLAGDALIVMFPITDQESMSCITNVAVKAAMVAAESIILLNGRSFQGRRVELRVVLDMGAVTAAIVGSQEYGWQYIVTGEPFSHLHHLLEEGGNGDILVTEKVWKAINSSKNNSFQATTTIKVGGATSYKLSCSNVFGGIREGCIKRERLLEQVSSVVEYDYLRAFAPRSVLHACEAEGSGWFSYIQRVTMVFTKVDVDRNMLLGTANSSCDGSSILLEKLQTIYSLMQEVVHDYGGTIKEFTVDDKGLILMCGMGVPPAIGDNQPEKACLVALKLVDVLQKRASCNAWVGISTGMVFTASVGTDRRELVMMGDAVNKAARLMMVAYSTFGTQGKSGVLVTQATYEDAKFRIEFEYWDTVKVKNKQEPITCYVPIAPLQGGYAVFLPGNFITVQRYSVNGENVAEVATTCVERLSRGDGGGILIMEGLPGLGKTSLLQGLANQWKKTFSSNCVKIISCRANNTDEAKLFIEYGERRRRSGGDGGGGGEVVTSGTATSAVNDDDEPTMVTEMTTEKQEASTSFSSSDNNNHVTNKQPTPIPPPRRPSSSNGDNDIVFGDNNNATTPKIQSSGEEHPLSSWRPVLVSFLLALKDLVMSYAVACDKTFSVLHESLGSSPLSGFELKFADSSDEENDLDESDDSDFLPRFNSASRFSTIGSEYVIRQHTNSATCDGEKGGTSLDHLIEDGDNNDPILEDDDVNNSEEDVTHDDDDDNKLLIIQRTNSCPMILRPNSKNIELQRKCKAMNNRGGHSIQYSKTGYSTAGSMLNVCESGDTERMNFRILDSLNTMSRENSAMPKWVNAFWTYPQVSKSSWNGGGSSSGTRESDDKVVGDTPWSRGMFLHFFFDLFMSSKSYVYWLIGDFLVADMPADIFPNEKFRSLAELPFEKFPITLADAIVEVLMLTAVGDLVPHMPVSFRAALLLDTPNSLCGPNLELVHRILSKPVLANRFLVVVVSTPLARTEGDMIMEGRIQNDTRISSKLIQIIQDLKEACNNTSILASINGILDQQQQPFWANVSSGSKRSLLTKSQSAFDEKTLYEMGGGSDDDMISEEKGMKALSISDHSNNLEERKDPKLQPRRNQAGRKFSQSNSSNNLIDVASYDNTKKTTTDTDDIAVERPQRYRQSIFGGGGKDRKSKRTPKASTTESAFHSMALHTRESNLLSLLLAFDECPHLSNDPSTIQRLQIAPVNFESCRILCAWSLGVDDVTDETAVALFMRTQGVPLFISKFTKLLQKVGVGSVGDVQNQGGGKSTTKGCAATSLRVNTEGEGLSLAPKSIWGFDVEGGLGSTICSRALSDVRLDGLVMMRSKIEGYLHSLSSQQLNILKILSCIGGVSPVPLDLFVSTYHQFVTVSWDRGLEVDIGILCECALVILSNGITPNKNERFINFSNIVVHQVVYWEIPEKQRAAVHKVGWLHLTTTIV